MKLSIRKPPLRSLNASRSAQLQELVERERAAVFLSCGVLALLAIAEGVSALLDGPRLVAAWILALIVTAGYDLYHLRRMRSSVRELEREALNDRMVRARLAGLAVAGARVFTDVTCGRSIAPVVILSQYGVYAADVLIATASSAAPVKVSIDESRFRYAGVTMTPNPARWIGDCIQPLQQVLLIGRTDDVIVRPLLIVAGAAIDVERNKGAPDVAVVSIDSLDEYIKSQHEDFSVTQVTMHAVRLAAHIREAAKGA